MLFIVALVAASFALTMLVFYPGYMTNDARYVYGFMQEWSFGDWQSPLMSILWWLVDPIAPGSASMFILIATLYWLGFGVLALTVARRSPWLGLAVPLLALLPPAFVFLGFIWRDVLFAVVWLLAAAIVYPLAERGVRRRWPVGALALGLVGLGILLRPNAIVAAPLLAAYVLGPASFNWKRVATIFVPALTACYALVQIVYYGVLDVKREHPLHSLMVFDLGGITYFTGENQFPVSWSDREAALLTGQCYNPRLWDSYWTIDPCQFVMQRLEVEGDIVFGTPRLVEAWALAVAAHPLAYLEHRATFMWTFLAGSNLTIDVVNWNDPSRAALTRNPLFKAVMDLHDALKPTPLFRVGFWLILAGAVCAFAWRARGSPAGAFAIGVTASAIVYVMTFFLAGVAADFRYGYWCVLATLAGAVTALVATRPASRAAAARSPA